MILCDNAVKHNRNNDDLFKINVDISEHNGIIYLRVIDNGKGISSRHEKHLFEPFFSTDRLGHGMGLYLAKELAEINDAQLNYDSLTKTGCCFIIEFGKKEIEYYE